MAMSKRARELYHFGLFAVDVTERVLSRDGQPVALPPKAFDLLALLVENSGHLLEKDELMRRLWPDTFVEEANLSNNISVLRKALTEDDDHRYIETVPRRGYRFVAEVEELSVGATEVIVAERTTATFTLEEEPRDRVHQAKPFLTGSPARRWAGWVIAAVALLVGVAAAVYSYWGRTNVAPVPIRSIAVLPFRPLVANAGDESFEMGMAETLITRLSGIKEVAVRPVSDVRKYHALEQDSLAAGREQKVDAVLDGNVQKTSERVRVTVRLVKVSDGQTLWADKFDERLSDIFALQDSISERVATAMAVKLTGEERQLLTRHHTDNPEAYQLYLKGCLYYKQWTKEGIEKALECFDKAIAIDPNYALAYAGKADLYSANASVFLPPSEAMPKAREAAQRALEIDDQLAEAHFAMAKIKQRADWDWSGAEGEFKRTLEIKPNAAETRMSYSSFLTEQKRFGEALTELKHAQELDPLSFVVSYRAGMLLYFMHQYEQAIAQCREVVALYPHYAEAYRSLGCALRQQGMVQEAIVELQKAVEMNRRDSFLSELGYTYALSGRQPEAIKLVNELEGLSKRRYVSPVQIARIYAGLGEKGRAFEWLHKGYEDRSDHLLILGVDPSFDGVRSDPRFTDLLRRIGLT
jgi:DNA-binding winged helix-turn-helix (wHTH) protein/TolB-like protein/Flp pilus assembly protein TadD